MSKDGLVMTRQPATPGALAAWSRLDADTAASGASIQRRARRVKSDPGPVLHALASGRYQSPLRYPGAKSALAPVIGDLLREAAENLKLPAIDLLVEPFAGGASTSLRLVGDGTVQRVLLADADPLIASFWQVAAAETDYLIDRLTEEWTRYVSTGGQKAVARWEYWRTWQPDGVATADTRRTMALKCIFLNRTTFSGILHGRAGPIGGRKQASDYGIGCRWNHSGLVARLRYVQHLYEADRIVDVWCKDWRQTLDDVAECYKGLVPSRVIAYLDPPYLQKSSRLYRTSFDPQAGYGCRSGQGIVGSNEIDALHLDLADYLRRRAQYRWLLSYDAHQELIELPELYGATTEQIPAGDDRTIHTRRVPTRYSAAGRNGKRSAQEFFITDLPL